MRQLFVRRAAGFELRLSACKVGETLPAPAAPAASSLRRIDSPADPPHDRDCRSAALRLGSRRGYITPKIFVDLSGGSGTV